MRQKETNKIMQTNNEIKSLFFEKTNRITKPLAKSTKSKREKTHINTIRNERGDITTDTNEIQKNHEYIP